MCLPYGDPVWAPRLLEWDAATEQTATRPGPERRGSFCSDECSPDVGKEGVPIVVYRLVRRTTRAVDDPALFSHRDLTRPCADPSIRSGDRYIRLTARRHASVSTRHPLEWAGPDVPLLARTVERSVSVPPFLSRFRSLRPPRARTTSRRSGTFRRPRYATAYSAQGGGKGIVRGKLIA